MSALAISNAALWVAVVALAFVVLALARQLGVLHERIAPAGALMLSRGLAVGEPAPIVEVSDLAGASHRIGAARSDARSTLVLFVSPTCPVCKALYPALEASRRKQRDSLEIILASDGVPDEHREFVKRSGLGQFPYVVSAALGLSYQVSRLPYAALVDAAGVLRARGLVNSREHLESLFEAQQLGVASLQEYLSASR